MLKLCITFLIFCFILSSDAVIDIWTDDLSDICLVEGPAEGESDNHKNENEEVEFSFDLSSTALSSINSHSSKGSVYYFGNFLAIPIIELLTPPPENI